MENIEIEPGDDGVTHGVLLEEMAGVGLRLHIIPCSPFVKNKSDLFLGVESIHNRDVVTEDFVNLNRFGNCLVVFGRSEVGG